MSECSFRIENTFFIEKLGRWAILGRAYADVRVGDALSASADSSQAWRVEEIETYGRKTALLSRMMTGTLVVSPIDEEDAPPEKSILYTVVIHTSPRL